MDDSQLKPNDLTLMGSFYSNGLVPVVVESRGKIELDTPKAIWLPLLLMTVVIASIATPFCWFVWDALATSPFPNKDQKFVNLVVPMAWVLAVFGPLIGHWLIARHMRSRSPLLSYDVESKRLSALRFTFTFPRDDVFGLLAIATADSSGDVKSELQLVIGASARKDRYLLATSIGGYISQTFGRQLREFCHLTKLPGYIAEHEGLSRTGKLVVRRYDAP